MARKDFAKVQVPYSAGHGMKNMRNTFVIAGMLIVVGASFVGGIMLGEKQGLEKAKYAGKQHLLQRLEKQRHELDTLRKTAESRKSQAARTKTQVGDLTFYNTLPNQKVAPAPLDTSQNGPGHERAVTDIIRRELVHRGVQSASGGAFRLQVGSYRRKEDADNLKARLKQHGFQAVVEQTTVPTLGLWFRVYTGPYASRGMAEQASLQVQTKMHITGLLLRD
ncbi:MAG: SPOR domain-containing protein [Mariprofundaceae bacterium]|nr:SPOR domain-containing protein [Mariprofundaceae bacterium]